MFNAAKDAITGRAAQTYLNDRIRRYGKIERLKIDSTNHQLEVVCHLDGEVSPITIKVGEYFLQSEGGRKFIKISDCTCSRPWLQNLLADYAEDRRFEVPAWAASAL